MAAALHGKALCVVICALFSRVASEVVLAHMTHEEYPKDMFSLCPLFLLLLFGYLGLLDAGPVGTLLAWSCATYCAVDAAQYAWDVVEEVSTHLGASLFQVKPRSD